MFTRWSKRVFFYSKILCFFVDVCSRILYQAVTKDANIVLTEQILQILVELWKIIVNHFRGAAALMIDSAMKGFLVLNFNSNAFDFFFSVNGRSRWD